MRVCVCVCVAVTEQNSTETFDQFSIKKKNTKKHVYLFPIIVGSLNTGHCGILQTVNTHTHTHTHTRGEEEMLGS